MSALIVHDARPVDASTAQVGTPSDVSIEDGSIVDVRPASGHPPRTRRSTVIDAGGRWLTQSLIDAHVHLHGVGPGAVGWGEEALAAYRKAGVTHLRDVTPHPTPRIQGPAGVRVVRADDPASAVGGGWTKAYARQPPELQAVIRRAHGRGTRVAAHLAPNAALDLLGPSRALPDSIEHVYTLLDYVLVADRERDSAGVDPRDRGVATWALAPSRPDARLSRLIDLLGARRAFVVPTLAVMRGLTIGSEPHRALDHAPAAVAALWRSRMAGFGWGEQMGTGRRRLRRAALDGLGALTRQLARAGARLVLGTDFGEPLIPPGAGVHFELDCLSRSGLHPRELLPIAIHHPRQMLGLPTGIGPGAPADLLLLDGDPTRNVASLSSPWTVIAGGSVVETRSAGFGRPRVEPGTIARPLAAGGMGR